MRTENVIQHDVKCFCTTHPLPIFIKVTGTGVACSALYESRQKLDLPILLVFHHIIHGVAIRGVPSSRHYEGVLHLNTTTPATIAPQSVTENPCP